MKNYADKFPNCSNCPKLAGWQESRDEMCRTIEEASIRDSFNGIEQEYFTESQRIETDENYAQFLDRFEAGSLDPDDSKIETARVLYTEVVNATESQRVKMQDKAKIVDTMTTFLMNIADSEATILAGSCKGTLEFSIFGMRSIICRSKMRRYSINPAPTYKD